MTGLPVLSVVEDHDIYRDTICAVVTASDEWRLDGVARSGEEAVAMFEGDHHCDLVLVDLSLPGMSGFELVSIVHERWPDIRCLILSGHARSSYAAEALAVGARGYVVKGTPRQLRTAIREVLAGNVYVSDSMAERDEQRT